MPIKILLADDHSITRDGLKALLEKERGMTVVAEADTGSQAVRLTAEHIPDVVVLDINMPELNGIEAARRILSESPQVKIIALSMYSEQRYVSGMLKAGVSGYVLKSSTFDELAQAIRAVMKNQGYLSQKIAHVVMKDYTDCLNGIHESPISSLTSREIEVLQLIAEGLSTNKIADHLCVSVKTISTHRRQLMDKLKVGSVAELTKIAIREGLVSLDD